MNAAFHGCSFTFGEGYTVSDWNKNGYPSLVSKNYIWEFANHAIPGSSNLKIFHSASKSILSGTYKKIFVQWSNPNRLWLGPGPSTWWFTNDTKFPDFTYRDLHINTKDQKLIKEKLLMLNHDYQNLIELCNYCNILEQLADYNKVQLIFINGLLHWSQDLFTPILTDLSTHFSNYTKEIFDFENRDDTELEQMHAELLKATSTINQSLWVNIFNSMQQFKIDNGPLGHHPGPKTQKMLAEKIIEYLG